MYTFNATARSTYISQREIESLTAIKWNSTTKKEKKKKERKKERKKNRLAYHYGQTTRFTECDLQFRYRTVGDIVMNYWFLF